MDQSNNDKLETYNSNIDNLLQNQNSEIQEENQKKITQSIYQGTTFNYGRKKRVLALDITNNLPDIDLNRKAIDNVAGDYWSHFRVNLKEDFIIDKVSDIYLESITINRPAQANNFSNLYYVIDIEEFNIKTNTNNTYMSDKFVIPNENTESFGNNKIMKYHKKSNYVAHINPTTLSSLTFKITNENGDTVNTNISSTKSGDVTNFTAIGTAVAITLTDGQGDNFAVNDTVYNGNNNLVGIVTAQTANNITIAGGTLIDLGVGEEIFISSFKTTTLVNVGVGIQIGNIAAINVDGGDATVKFTINSKVYLGNGSFVGTVTAVTATTITIGDGTQIYLSNNDVLYNGNTQGTVFSSNSKSNRMIIEFVLITK